MWKGWQAAPLPSSFMLTAIIGFTISAFWVYPRDLNWGFTFLLFFTLMFVASVISTTHASVRDLTILENRESIEQLPLPARKKQKKVSRKSTRKRR